ncbi:MAG TPA: trypsin-like peptidase domain-containing protein, partial [Gemmatimonadaceae bacterium]|nr:trypsin-like peptidase domain-containing protein [Gemmatimonadaceae bacterium]
MSNRFTLVSIGLIAPVTFLIGLAVAGSLAPVPGGGDRSITAERVGASTVPLPARSAAPASESAGRPAPQPISFADVADRINAAVVNIDASIAGASLPHAGSRRPDDLPDPPGGPDDSEPRQGAGSGFIIDHDGYILTNHHLVDGAERLVVTLADGRSYRAAVVGIDPAIDVALVKIPGSSSLPVAPLGDSDGLRVGEWVCAIGNPLGYVHSVTVGVVSFMGRKLFDRSLDDYIQTDAAINFGNSGGPLINVRGEVVGINSAISSRANNIGFAVPINQARAILPQLKARGRVSRGFIGIILTDVTPDLQRSLHLTVSRGALVQDIAPNSPGERAGIRAYDVVTAVDGRTIWTNDELIREISA